MTSVYPAPKVTGVTDGKLNLDQYPQPEIIIDYPAIDRPHNVSVLWEIAGPLTRYVHWCGFQVRRANETPLFTAHPDSEYAHEGSNGNHIVVRYSILLEGESEPVSSETLSFAAESKNVSAPGQSFLDLSVRETTRQWQGLSWWIFHQQISSSSFEDYATVYVTGTSIKVALVLTNQNDEQLWQSDFQTPPVQDPPKGTSNLLEFKVPKQKIMECQGIGYLSVIHEPDTGFSGSRAIRICVDQNCNPNP